MRLKESLMPIIYVTDTVNRVPIVYGGNLEVDEIRIWAKELAEGRIETVTSTE